MNTRLKVILWVTFAVLLAMPGHAQPEATAGGQATVTASHDGLRLLLPPEIYSVVGHEMSIYFDNVMLVPSLDNYLVAVRCNVGRQQQHRWAYVPKAEEIGSHNLKLQLYDLSANLLAEAETVVHVVPADAGTGREVSLLAVGDSLTANGHYPAELVSLCRSVENPQLRMIGTRSGPAEGAVHEGYGGWTWRAFATRWLEDRPDQANSPFMRLEEGKPILDFWTYCAAQNSGVGPDFITVLLGCNDVFSATDENIEEVIDELFGHASTLLAEFHRVRPDTQIGVLLLVPPAASQDAFGANYGCRQPRWQYRRNQHRLVERQLEQFGGREAENIFIVPALGNLDCVNNYPARSEPANARNQQTVVRQNNSVHPSPEGYHQIADSIYCWLKYRLSQ